MRAYSDRLTRSALWSPPLADPHHITFISRAGPRVGRLWP